MTPEQTHRPCSKPIDPETRAGNILERYVGATYVASILTEFMGAGLAIVDRGAKIDTSSGERR